MDFSNIDFNTIATMILAAGLGVFLKDILVGGLGKLKAFVAGTTNTVDDKIVEIILQAADEAAKKAVVEAKPTARTITAAQKAAETNA